MAQINILEAYFSLCLHNSQEDFIFIFDWNYFFLSMWNYATSNVDANESP